jgi:hypothetical protein
LWVPVPVKLSPLNAPWEATTVSLALENGDGRIDSAHHVMVARSCELAFIIVMLNRHVGEKERLVAVGRLALVSAVAPVVGDVIGNMSLSNDVHGGSNSLLGIYLNASSACRSTLLAQSGQVEATRNGKPKILATSCFARLFRTWSAAGLMT